MGFPFNGEGLKDIGEIEVKIDRDDLVVCGSAVGEDGYLGQSSGSVTKHWELVEFGGF